MIDTVLDTALQSERLALAQDDDNHLTSLEHSLDAHGQGRPRNLGDVVVEETRVGKDGVVGQGLYAGPAGQARSGLVEGNVAVLSDASKEEVNAADCLDGVLVGGALGVKIGGVSVENVNVGRVHIYVREEVVPHERVV